MRIVAFACVMLVAVSASIGQEMIGPRPHGEAAPYVTGKGDHQPPIPRPRSASQPASYASVPASDRGITIRLEHLVEATVHLESAGEVQQAKQVRRLVALEREALANRLRLRKSDSGVRQIKVQFRAMVLSLTRLKELGLEWKPATLNDDAMVNRGNEFGPLGGLLTPDVETAFLAMIETLRNDGVVRVLAEPVIVATSGRPASFQSGGSVARVQADEGESLKEVGTQIDLVPAVIEPDRIRLEVKIAVSELVPGAPRPFVRNVDTVLEMKSGQTKVIRGLLTNSKERNEVVETLFLITPEIIPLT